MDLKGPQHMGRRAGQTRRLAMGCPLTPHRVLSIELVSTREPRGSGTEGPGGDGEGPAAPPCPTSPPRRGADRVEVYTYGAPFFRPNC